jgi:hypothetical protein
VARRRIASLHEALAPYVEMIRQFVRGEVELAEFERRFNDRYLNSSDRHSADVFHMLDEFFSDIDNCVPPPDQPDPKFVEITPDELRERAITLLQAGGYEL